MGTFPGLSEALDDVKSLLATEQKEYQKSPAGAPVDIDGLPDIVLDITKHHENTDTRTKHKIAE